jgi:hypothetical protein
LVFAEDDQTFVMRIFGGADELDDFGIDRDFLTARVSKCNERDHCGSFVLCKPPWQLWRQGAKACGRLNQHHLPGSVVSKLRPRVMGGFDGVTIVYSAITFGFLKIYGRPFFAGIDSFINRTGGGAQLAVVLQSGHGGSPFA